MRQKWTFIVVLFYFKGIWATLRDEQSGARCSLTIYSASKDRRWEGILVQEGEKRSAELETPSIPILWLCVGDWDVEIMAITRTTVFVYDSGGQF